MASFISFFKKSPAFSFAFLFIILLEIILRFIPNLEYLETGGSFFTYHKRNISEDNNINYDILIYGDSRSLSLNGFANNKKDLSVYNFSLPAAGPRYVEFFLKKYITHHEKKPKAVVWAIDMEQLQVSKNQTFDTNKEIWQTYKHRLLNLFSYWESIEQYSGMEFVFITKEYIPNLFYTFKFRIGIRELLNGLKPETFTKLETFHTKQNKDIVKLTSINHGQINLGDFFLADENQRIQGFKGSFKSLEKDNIEFTFEPLNRFIKLAHSNQIPVIILVLPKAEKLYSTKTLSKIHFNLKYEFLEKKNVLYMEYAELNYPVELFGEGIHFTTEGAEKLNSEYEKNLLPKMIDFAKRGYEN
jgi:hypothetical protein